MKFFLNFKSRIIKLRKILLGLEFGGETKLAETLISLYNELEINQKNHTDLLIHKFESNRLVFPEMDYLFLRLSDISKLVLSQRKINWSVFTEKEIAIDSLDHIVPRGVKADETRSPGFVKAVKTYFKGPVNYMDLGCAGGGLVYDFILEDCRAIGIEGSDYSLRHNRAYWREIPWALFTADLTSPLQVSDESGPAKFDAIGAWEFFEHIAERDISSVLDNVKKHLRNEYSLLLANIATFEDHEGDVHWHQTIQNEEWWVQKFNENGFELIKYPFEQNLNPRGSGNKLGTWQGDYDIEANPHMGFCIAARCIDLKSN